MALILSFANHKGGVGKSTLTALIANLMAQDESLKLAVIDVDDRQQSLSRLRDKEVTSGKKINYKVIRTTSKDAVQHLPSLSESYDIILLDFPGNMKQEGIITLYHALDIIIVPTSVNILDLDSTNLFLQSLGEIQETRAKIGKKTEIRVVLNRVLKSSLEYKEIQQLKEDKLLPFVLMDSSISDSKVKFQRNLTTSAENNSAEDIINLYEEICLIIKHYNHG